MKRGTRMRSVATVSMADSVGGQIVNGDLALGPEIRIIAPVKDNLVRRLPPWRALAVTMAGAMDHLPQALRRPFMMNFLTTALAPATALFDDGTLARRYAAWPHFISTAPGVAYAYLEDYRRNRPDVMRSAPFIALGPVRAVFVHAEGGLLLKRQRHQLGWAFASGLRAGRFAAQAAQTSPDARSGRATPAAPATVGNAAHA